MSAAVSAVALEMHAHLQAKVALACAGVGVGVKGGGNSEPGAHFAAQPGPMATTATVVQSLLQLAARSSGAALLCNCCMYDSACINA